jgi:DNA-directed RNA polymerase specialized sigma subunit
MAEDFAQHYAVCELQNKIRNIRYMYIDWFRKETNYRRLKIESDSEVVLFKNGIKIPPARMLDRAVMILYGSWGFTMAEIAHTLGVSEAWVSKKIKKLRV